MILSVGDQVEFRIGLRELLSGDVLVPVGAVGVVAEICRWSGDVKVDVSANVHVNGTRACSCAKRPPHVNGTPARCACCANGTLAHVRRDEKLRVLRPRCPAKWILTSAAAAQHVRKQKSTRSDKLGSRPRGSIVSGARQGNWLALIDEPGFMLVKKPDGTELLRLFEEAQREPFVLTLHVGEVSPHGLADVAVTSMGGDEVASIRADLNNRVGSLRTLVSETVEEFASCIFMLPDGSVLSDDSARLGDVLEGMAVVGGDGDS